MTCGKNLIPDNRSAGEEAPASGYRNPNGDTLVTAYQEDEAIRLIQRV
jgi:hypothetical protein